MFCTRAARQTVFGLFAVALAVFSPAAHAAVIELSYDFSNGNTVSMALGGALQSDGNTFDVSSVQSIAVNGSVVADPFAVASTDAVYMGASTNPVVTINGCYLDLFVTDTLTGNVFGFAVNDLTSQVAGANLVGASTGLGGDGGPDVFSLAAFDPTVVPEPHSAILFIGMLAMGSLLLASSRRLARRCVLSAA